MPRDGSSVYHLPDPDVAPDTTIESAVYNNLTNDVEQDLNLPRPIVAGGTGATSADGALANLGGETAFQVVTNYDSYAFKPGSFYSTPGATSAPTAGNYFVGICYMMDANSIVLEARLFTGGTLTAPYVKYLRVKGSGVWSAWSAPQPVDLDAAYVNATGDTMTGDLAMTKASPTISLNKTAVAQTAQIYSNLNTVPRWVLRIANDTAETGSNAGSNFDLLRFNDAGAYIGNALQINRATGNAVIGGQLNTDGQIVASGDIWSHTNTANTGTYYFGSNGTKALNYDGTSFVFAGGPVVVPLLNSNGRVTAVTPGASAQFQLVDQTSSTSKYLRNNANNFEIVNNAFNAVIMTLTDAGNFTVSGSMGCAGATCSSLNCSGAATASSFQVGNTALASTSLEIGSQTVAQSAFVDFHSSGTAGDFDGRIICSGGSGIGNGTMTYNAGGHTFGNAMIVTGTIEAQGGLYAAGHRNRQGFGAAGYGANWWNLYWTSGGNIQVWIDSTNIGNLTATSDYRTKKDIAALPDMWKTVKALRPIKYTRKDFTPPTEQENAKKTGKPFMLGDDIERWGFVAHELQETLVDSAASCAKDAPNAVQSPDMVPVIAALTKALQEAMARIEALETR